MPATSSCRFSCGFNFSYVHLFVKHHWIRACQDSNELKGVWEHRHDFSHKSDPTRIQPCCPMTQGRKQQEENSNLFLCKRWITEWESLKSSKPVSEHELCQTESCKGKDEKPVCGVRIMQVWHPNLAFQQKARGMLQQVAWGGCHLPNTGFFEQNPSIRNSWMCHLYTGMAAGPFEDLIVFCCPPDLFHRGHWQKTHSL